ncbi:MAG: PfaD family polyunsaturated fatty acid/polyketide biosynthesis protein, partial [Anaerolineae bacterium]|nr:PfaD family polyunsaturated fatty acid/polyketide biosynthesis protein [Anaerolineae bacterium]
HPAPPGAPRWQGATDRLSFDVSGVRQALLDLDLPVYLVDVDGATAAGHHGQAEPGGLPLLAYLPPLPYRRLGDPEFQRVYKTGASYYAGSMANGISSVEMVLAMAHQGWLASFGAGGLSPEQVAGAIHQIKQAAPEGPWLFNLLNNPFETGIENALVDLYLAQGVRAIEASAYLTPSLALTRYRAAGLSLLPDGSIHIQNRIIAKVSRKETAAKFLAPAAGRALAQLVQEGSISEQQATLAQQVPLADDITVEADSGGHTDHRPLLAALPAIQRQAREAQKKYGYAQLVRVGAAGGMGRPEALWAAFALGAAYIATGSVNQSCREAATSPAVKALLAQAESTDVTDAPAADMFEMGTRVQVLKRGTQFAQRGLQLYDLYTRYDRLADIPPAEREKLEHTLFQRPIQQVWQETQAFFASRDPRLLEKARQDEKQRMALVFRWYLGQASHWAIAGAPGREADYQVWCGPAMGAFNDWVRGSGMDDPADRSAPLIADRLMRGAAYFARLSALDVAGIRIAPDLRACPPDALVG